MSEPLERTEPKETLKVATLNYSGIMDSHFDFYWGVFQQELKDIGQVFVRLLPNYFPEFSKKTSNGRWERSTSSTVPDIPRCSPLRPVSKVSKEPTASWARRSSKKMGGDI
jgi:hypothetical protein